MQLGLVSPPQNSTQKQVLAFGPWAWKWQIPLHAIAAGDKFIKFIKNVPKKCIRPMNAPKIICHNHMQPHACAGCHPKALLKFSTFDSDPDRTPQILTAAMGPMGVRRVLPLVLAPSGRSGQTHAWGCYWHVWAQGHALGCIVPAC